MLVPFMGLPLSECNTSGCATITFRQTRFVNQLRGQLTGLTLMNLPGHNLATVEIQDQVEVIKQTPDRSRQPCDIPTPHLIGAAGTVGTQGLVLWCFTATSVVLLLCLPQDPVEGRLRGQITPSSARMGTILTRCRLRNVGLLLTARMTCRSSTLSLLDGTGRSALGRASLSPDFSPQHRIRPHLVV